MTIPNTLPIRLSDVIAEFGGSNPPKNLGAYRAGAGYTPAGAKGGSAAIPTPNGNIPSSFPLNLGAFPGAKKELSVTQYWPFKDYFHRNFFYWGSNPPQTIANNTDATTQYNSSKNAGYISASQVGWQKKVFNNASNGSLPDSAQCTVVFMVAGSAATYTNTMSNGTSLSVRALDPSGAEMHMSPIAYGKYNFQTGSGTSTLSESALVWASFNCSIKKITTVCTGIYPNGSNTASDELLILPGLKKVKEYAVARDNTGYDIKPANPIAPDEVVFGMRYDGGGDYEIQYTNQTFPNWVRSSNWWYNQVGLEIEANVGTSPVALTTTCPQDYNPSNVWCVMNDNTAAVYAPGINPIWPSLVLYGSNLAGSITVKRNGSVTGTIGAQALDLPNYPTCPENWYIGNPMNGSWPGDNYWVMFNPNSSTTAPTGPTGWVSIASNPTWSGIAGTTVGGGLYIANNAQGTNAVYLGSVTLSVASGGGGGGGGGGCVEVSSFVAGGTRAGETPVGATLQLANPETLEESRGEVTYSEMKVMPGWQIETESGIILRCSDTAPIPVREGGYKVPSELQGQYVATRRDAPEGNKIQWERVERAYPIGEITVQHITVGDQNFWAGQTPAGYILHHNLKDANAAN